MLMVMPHAVDGIRAFDDQADLILGLSLVPKTIKTVYRYIP